MNVLCIECGATMPDGGTCRDNFYTLLALEQEAPDAERVIHFYAVAAYILQHPDSMSYTAQSLRWLHSALASVLSGQASIDALRLMIQRQPKELSRVIRKDGDPVHHWGVQTWTLNVTDVLAGRVEGYISRVEMWVQAVIADLSKSESYQRRSA